MLTTSQFIQFIIILILIYMILYAIVNRICSCIESRGWSRAFNTYMELTRTSGGNAPNVDEFAEALKNINKKNSKEDK